MRASCPRSGLSASIGIALSLLTWMSSPALADVCVAVDEARDTFSPSDRSAALLLLARQFELAGERVVPPGCPNEYVVSHVQFGSRITITMSGPLGQRDATAMSKDDVPAVYSQMVRSLLRGLPMDATGVVDRTNVSGTQASSPNRIHTDSVWYARLGYGAQFADQTYGGPSVGFLGYRREGNRYGIDVSFFNFQYKSSSGSAYGYGLQQSSGMTGSWLKLEILRYFKPTADRSFYGGAGLSWSTTNLDHDTTSWEGSGLQGELTAGYELGRAGSIHVFVQGDVGLPFFNLRSTTYTYASVPPFVAVVSVTDRYVPSFTVSLGLGWQPGGGK
jgi:hypothetical protein